MNVASRSQPSARARSVRHKRASAVLAKPMTEVERGIVALDLSS